jgi:ADP-heptose:LPS heptosyltransferase
MSNFVVSKDYNMGQYMPREYLRLLESIGIFTDDTKKYIFWSKDADIQMTELISRINRRHSIRIGIMPGAGNKIKQWPAERFATVADYLIDTHQAHIFVIGNESNREEINTMLSHIKNKEYVTECSSLSLDESKALISKMYMTVSVDTGPIFIAEACGVPTIDIGGVIHPNDMAPNDGKTHILITYDGEPLLWSLNSRVYDYEKARAGIESITVCTVIEKIDELLTHIEQHKSND